MTEKGTVSNSGNYIRIGEDLILTKKFLKSVLWFKVEKRINSYAIIAHYICDNLQAIEKLYVLYSDSEPNCEFELNILLTAVDKILNS